jgi:hypothetical protein
MLWHLSHRLSTNVSNGCWLYPSWLLLYGWPERPHQWLLQALWISLLFTLELSFYPCCPPGGLVWVSISSHFFHQKNCDGYSLHCYFDFITNKKFHTLFIHNVQLKVVCRDFSVLFLLTNPMTSANLKLNNLNAERVIIWK